MADPQGGEKFITIEHPGVGGLHTIVDAQDIEDTEMADCRNVVFNGGYVTPRQGFKQLFAKPSGETGSPNTLAVGRSSDSVDYLIAIYGTNFYLWDPTNEQTINLNTGSGITYTTTPKSWGYTSWDAGTGSDVMYFANGVDTTTKWQMALTTLTAPLSSTSTTASVVSNTKFTATGTLVVQDPASGVPFSVAWTSKTGTTTLNFSGSAGHSAATGSSVTSALIPMPLVPTSSIVLTFQRRLFSIGGVGIENIINYSKVNAPENFTDTSGANGAGAETLADGLGPITAAYESGGYVFIGKQNSWSQFQFIYSSDVTTSKLVALNEVVSGRSSGPISQQATLKAMNDLAYISMNDGIIEMVNGSAGNTSTSGSSTVSESISMAVLSDKINDRLSSGPGQIYFYDNATAHYWDQKGFWAVATAANTANSLILVYDYLFKYWTIFDGWDAQDFETYQNDFYFLSNTDGSVNQGFTGYQDGSAAYTAYYTTKRFDFGQPSLPKTLDKVFLQGLISTGTTLTINAYMNENGNLNTQNYTLAGNNSQYVAQASVGALGQYALGTVAFGTVQNPSMSDVSHYRVYLDISNSFGFYNLQLKFSSTIIGANWAVDKMGFNPIVENTYPTGLVLAPG